jgi:hypothetical protein
MQINARISSLPRRFGRLERWRLSVFVGNVLAGLDLASHGVKGLKGWGQSGDVDPVLLNVRAFDQQSRRFAYLVNQRFGQTRARTEAFWDPARVILDVQVDVIPDPRRRRVDVLLHGGVNALKGPRLGSSDLLNRLVGAGPTALGLPVLRPDLGWLSMQRDSAEKLRAALRVQERAALAALADYLAGLPAKYDVGAVERHLSAAFDASGERHALAVRALDALLSSAQREALSFYLRTELDPERARQKRARQWY